MIVRGSTMSTAGKVARKAKAQMDQDVQIKKEKKNRKFFTCKFFEDAL